MQKLLNARPAHARRHNAALAVSFFLSFVGGAEKRFFSFFLGFVGILSILVMGRLLFS